jgi:hypothetical protein
MTGRRCWIDCGSDVGRWAESGGRSDAVGSEVTLVDPM